MAASGAALLLFGLPEDAIRLVLAGLQSGRDLEAVMGTCTLLRRLGDCTIL